MNMNIYGRMLIRWSLFALFALWMGSTADARATGAVLAQSASEAIDSPAAPLDTPTTIVDEPVDEFVLHAGVLYWANRCFVIPLQAASSPQEDSYFRRKPAAGGATTTLSTDPSCYQFESLAVDERDAIYSNGGLNRIERIRLTVANSTAISITNANGVDNLVIDRDFVYFTISGNKIYRAPRSGGQPITLFNANFNIGDLAVDGQSIYWFDQSGLWWADKSCDAPPCTGQKNVASTPGRYMQLGEFGFAGDPRTVYAVVGGNTQSIIAFRCRSERPCPVDYYYTAANGWTIQDYRIVSLPGSGPFPVLRTYLFWTEVHYPTNIGRLLRRQVGSTATPDELYSGDANLLSSLGTDSSGIYFTDSAHLLHLPFTASAIVRDLAADGLEVNQAIQNMANQAPLVADKPTYVRLYAKSLSGPRAGGVEAHLIGIRNGQPLPGSPLQPINIGPALTLNIPYDRAKLGDGWLFKLPASWTSGGSLALTGVIDPRKRYADTDALNNSQGIVLSLDDKPNACLFFSPVRTHNPRPRVGDPNFWETLDRFTRLWPVAKTDVRWMGEPIEELEFCSKWGIPYPCWGPYELDQGVSITNFPSDKDRVIIKLIVRQVEARILSLPPISMCEFGATVHSVGMVHPLADTTSGNVTTNGYANLFFNASWVKFPPHDQTPFYPPWNWPVAADVLAQEVTHNFWRNHVDCGNPEGIDDDWPYTQTCQLNDGGQTNYYGFDPASRMVIPPEVASDFMSYRPSRSAAPKWQGHWVSDYTYRAVAGKFLAQANAASQSSLQAPNLAAADQFVYVSGAAQPDAQLGYLEYAYVQPTESLSAAALQVWQGYIAPSWDGSRTAPATVGHTHAFTYHLRLKDSAGGVLADHALSLLQPDQHGFDLAASPFLVTFPAPTGTVARIELLNNEQLLDSLDIGPGQPTVQILAPTTDETVNNTLTIRWQGNDPDTGDVLHYNLHYSPDDGVTWLPLATDFPGVPGDEAEEFTLNVPEALPGSNGKHALVRVTASDGYHTASAVAGPFTVSQRPPQPAILSPSAGSSLPAGETALLRGLAYDAEDGLLADEALRWTVDGAESDSGADVVVAGLRPGDHPITLRATDSDGQQGEAQATLPIDPLFIPTSTGAPNLDGSCEDGAYANGRLLLLAPASDGAQARVALLQRGDSLWLCFSGLPRGSNELIGQAALYADVDESADAQPQTDDLGFLVGEDGGLMVLMGDGSGGYVDGDPSGLAGRVSATADFWQAELQIALTSLGGLGHSMGVMVGQFNVVAAQDGFVWPYAATRGAPNSWAQAVLGDWPQITALEPLSTTVGSSVVLIISGQRFAPTATVLINGEVMPTTVISPSQLTADLTSAAVATAGVAQVEVVNPGISNAPSNRQLFHIQNISPTITSLAPSKAPEAGEPFVLTLQGSHFAPGAVVRWNGEALNTTFSNSGQLQAQVRPPQLVIARPVTIEVENPGPGGGLSNQMLFTVTPTFRVLLPLVERGS
jgi:hypothetical protein